MEEGQEDDVVNVCARISKPTKEESFEEPKHPVFSS